MSKRKIVLGTIIVLVLVVIGFIVQYNLANPLYKLEREEFERWFVFDEVVVYEQALIWQEGGLGPEGLGILYQEQIDEILASWGFEESAERTQRDIKALLEGGFPLIGEYGSDFRFEAERFLNGIFEIDAIIYDSEEIEYMNIFSEWNRFLNVRVD